MIINWSIAKREFSFFEQTITQIMLDTIKPLPIKQRRILQPLITNTVDLNCSFLLFLGNGLRVEEKLFKIAAALEFLNLAIDLTPGIFNDPIISKNKEFHQTTKKLYERSLLGNFLYMKSIEILAKTLKSNRLEEIILSLAKVSQASSTIQKKLKKRGGCQLEDYFDFHTQRHPLASISLSIGIYYTLNTNSPQKALFKQETANFFSIYTRLLEERKAFTKNCQTFQFQQLSASALLAINKLDLPISNLVQYSAKEIQEMVYKTNILIDIDNNIRDYKEKALRSFEEVLPAQSLALAQKIILFLEKENRPEGQIDK